MRAILDVLIIALNLYKLIIIVAAVMSWLIAFNVVNVRNEVVRSVWSALVAMDGSRLCGRSAATCLTPAASTSRRSSSSWLCSLRKSSRSTSTPTCSERRL